MQGVQFISQFLKYPKEVGTLTQSSHPLAKEMARAIGEMTEVIEFGPGTGPVTLELLKQLPEDGQLTCFETNEKFCEQLEKVNDPRLRVINDDATNCEEYVENLDCIVSGLPLAVFDKPKREEILKITRKSKKYIQLQYTPVLGRKIKNYFSNVKIKFVPFNFPPAFVYLCNSSSE